MVRLTGSVSPDADRTATTKSSRFCLFVPLFKLNVSRLHSKKLNALSFNTLAHYVPAVQSINQTSGYMDMYRTISFVAKEINTIILLDSPIP